MRSADQNAFSDLIADMQASSSEDNLQAAMSAFGSRLGFEWFAYVRKAPNNTHAHATYPREWQALYVQRNYMDVDPILKEAQSRPEVFGWRGEEFRKKKIQNTFFRIASDFNVRNGVTIPIAGAYGEFSALTFAASDKETLSPRYPDKANVISLAALHYHVNYTRALALAPIKKQPVLTPKEKVCLAWISRGKTAAEASEILNVHVRTIIYHLNSAKQRLGAVSLPQAVRLALKLGEIE